jgi:hypothetical protein
MSLQSINSQFGVGGAFLSDGVLRKAINELQGLTITPVVGLNSNTKMAIAAMRTEDTILAALLQGGVTTVGVSEVQHIDVDATGGTFRIAWNGQTTVDIAYNALAATVQTALENLTNIAVGDVVVTGGVGKTGGGTPYILTWSPYLGNVAEPTTVVTGTPPLLTGGGASAAVSTTTAGVQQIGGLFTDDKAQITIQETHAYGTLTHAGNVTANDYFAVNGVTYTFKTTPTLPTDILRIAGNNTNQAAATAAVVNAYENRLDNVPAIVATSLAGVVTFTSIRDGAGNAIVVTGTATTLAEGTSGTASATLTPVSVVATDTFVLNGVTFTARAEPTLDTEFDVEESDVLQGIEIAQVINAYEDKYLGVLDAVASANATTGVVTIVPRTPKYGNIIPLDETVDNATKSSTTLTNGTNTGGIKSTTDLRGESLVVWWYNKK